MKKKIHLPVQNKVGLNIYNTQMHSVWPGHYNNVGCSARLEISFELNLLLRVNKVTLLYFTKCCMFTLYIITYLVQ